MSKPIKTKQPQNQSTEVVPIKSLKSHSRNYRKHPEDQLKHIAQSIKDHGFYRNVVVANDNTILAGHGLVQAAMLAGITDVPIFRLNINPDSPQAMKVLTGDNEISKLCDFDDRALTEILKEIMETSPDGLVGTGFDANMLAALAFVSRPENEINNLNEAGEWLGMPDFQSGTENDKYKIIMSFRTIDDRHEFAKRIGITITDLTKSVWWPEKKQEDISSVEFKEEQ